MPESTRGWCSTNIMASDSAEIDNLDINPFFRTLQGSFRNKFEDAQRKCWIICIPCARCLRDIKITGQLIDTHIYKPSPYFKGQFVSTDKLESRTIELDGTVIRLVSEKSEYLVNIVAEELSYNQDYQPFKMYIIDNLLDPSLKMSCSVESQEMRLISHDGKPRVTFNDCLTYLRSFPEHMEVLHKVDRKLAMFNNNYMILGDYLHDAVVRLEEIVTWASKELAVSHHPPLPSFDPRTVELKIAIEGYILKHVQQKLFAVIRQKFLDEDSAFAELLLQLHELGLTADQLGVPQTFCCPLPRAVVELASLNSKSTPREKLLCLSNTLELMTDDVASSLKDSHSVFDKQIALPNLSSDDLIPLIVTVLVQARPQYFESNLYYIQNFIWEVSPKDKQSFSLVTFQAAKEFIKSHDFSHLKPSNNKVKKEMSLEELMRVTMELQKQSSKSSTDDSPTNRPGSPIDKQLEKITKMIEDSTKEFRQQEDRGSKRNTTARQTSLRNGRSDGLGEFLASLQQNCLGVSYGKQS